MSKLERAFAALPESAESAERERWIEFANRTAEDARGDLVVDERAKETAHRLVALTSEETQVTTPAGSRDTADSIRIEALAELLGSDSRSGGSTWISAEISSLFAEGDDPPHHPGPGDHVVLLTSDSDRGVRTAHLLGQILSARVGGDLATASVGNVVSSGPVPGSGPETPLDFARPGVTVVTVGGLTADGRDAVQRSAVGLAEVLGTVYVDAASADKALHLHLIGGFKATIPLVTALAAHLPTGRGVEIDLWSSNRQTPEGIRLPLLRLGVPDEEFWDLQRIGSGGLASSHASSLRSARWDGYAWRDNGEQIELTELGSGILRLLAVIERRSAR